MKNIKKLFEKTAVVISLEIAIAVFLGVLITLFVIIPNYGSWLENRAEIAELEERIDKVSKNIDAARNLDESEIDGFDAKLELALPSEADSLRFLTLVEKVAGVSGMKFSSAQVTTSKTTVQPTTPVPNQPAETPSLSTDGGTAGNTTSTTQGTGTSSGSQSGLILKLSFTGSFPALLSLLANFETVDRVALITGVSITKSGEDKGISVAVNFNLPLSSKAGEVSAETLVLLTDQEKEALKEILDKMVITAAPAKSKTGRSDPFE